MDRINRPEVPATMRISEAKATNHQRINEQAILK